MKYNVIVPSLEHSGPTNLAIALASQAQCDGFDVRIYFLNEPPGRVASLHGLESAKLRTADILSMTGVVHSHGLRPDIIGAVIKAVRRKRVVSLTTIHMHFLDDLLFLYNRIAVYTAFKTWKAAISRLDRRFCISQAMLDYYEQLMPRANFDLAYNGVPDQRDAEPNLGKLGEIEPWIMRHREEGRRILGFVGAFIERKNLLKLVDEVLRRPSMALAVCGDGALEVRARAIAGDSDRIIFLGNQPHAITLLQDVDMFVLPSLSEGMPLVVLEAASIGKPTLMSDLPVHRELGMDHLGVTFSQNDFVDFDAKVKRTLTLDGADIRKRYERRFTPASCWSKYKTQIEECAELL